MTFTEQFLEECEAVIRGLDLAAIDGLVGRSPAVSCLSVGFPRVRAKD